MALRAVSLRKVYGSMFALDELSFTVKPGEIVGLLGPNGAGKTTTINMILGVLQPTSGGVLIGEIDLAKHRARALYGRVYRHAVRTGLLARYSAESAA
jgi:ABC-2 type transport system ATP-binding protein